ncbi:oligosaccharide flippase family protein [Vibrio diabolicus]|uniref:oligosaccharide flippase family protein n=1 Tax=Vibrio diabolicus TaxID=50719 RepID=UPI0037538F55
MRCSVLLLSIFAANTLDIGDLAKFTNSLILFQIMSALSLAGLSNVLIKDLAEIQDARTRASFSISSLTLILILSMFLSIIYVLLIYYLHNDEVILLDTLLFALSITLSALLLSFMAIAQGLFDYKTYLQSSAIYSLVILVILVFFWWSKFSFLPLVLFIANALSLVFIFFRLKHSVFDIENFEWKKNASIDNALGIFKKSYPIFISSLLVMPVMFIGNILITKYSNDIQVSIYNLAFQWRNVVALVPAAIIQAFLPYMVKSGKGAQISSTMIYIYIVVVLMTCFVSYIFVQNIDLLYGVEILQYKDVFYFMVLSSIVSSIGGFVGQYFLANSNYYLCLSINVFWSCTYLMMLYFSDLENISADGLTLILLCSYMALVLFQVGIFIFGKIYRREY